MIAPELLPQIEQSTTRQHFTDIRHVNVRWEPYKADGARQMKVKGRWQEQVGSGDYWRWQNCDRPAFAHALAPDVAALVEAAKRAAELMERHGLSGGLVSDLRTAIRAMKGGAT